ncbi:hypothetical protein QE152_g36772 [Popillia japonica]|uniref:Uncharacterized protein n=1 Tax=Popillia japonica TaxID=7064 RepID=A0AAW1ICH4_POPJA
MIRILWYQSSIDTASSDTNLSKESNRPSLSPMVTDLSDNTEPLKVVIPIGNTKCRVNYPMFFVNRTLKHQRSLNG